MWARRAPSAKRGGRPNWKTQLKRPPTMRTASAPPSAVERAAFHEHRVVVGNRTPAHGRGHEGDAAIHQPLEGRARLRPAPALPHDDERALRLREHLSHGFDGGGVGMGARDLGRARPPADGVLIETRADELRGKVQVDGAGAAVEGAPEGEVNVLGDARLAVDLRRPLARGRREGHLIRLLEGAEAALVARRGAAQHDQGHGALGGHVHGRDGVRERRPRADDEHARLPPRPAPGRGGEAGGDFMAAVHDGDPLALHCRHDLDHGPRDHAEGRIDAGRLQLPRDDLSAVQFRHVAPPSVGVAAIVRAPLTFRSPPPAPRFGRLSCRRRCPFA